MRASIPNTASKMPDIQGADELIVPSISPRSYSAGLSSLERSFLDTLGVLDRSVPITVETIKALHRFACSSPGAQDRFHKENPGTKGLTLPLNPGEFREQEYRNRHAFSLGSPVEEIEADMDALVALINASELSADRSPQELAAQAYLSLIDIHPFGDGNGRASRLLMNGLLERYQARSIDVSLIDWHNLDQIGFIHIPNDTKSLAHLIDEAAAGISTHAHPRYSHPDGSPVRRLGIQQLSDASEKEILLFFRGFIGAAFPRVDFMSDITEKYSFSRDEQAELLGILQAGEKYSTHPATRSNLAAAICHYSRKWHFWGVLFSKSWAFNQK